MRVFCPWLPRGFAEISQSFQRCGSTFVTTENVIETGFRQGNAFANKIRTMVDCYRRTGGCEKLLLLTELFGSGTLCSDRTVGVGERHDRAEPVDREEPLPQRPETP